MAIQSQERKIFIIGLPRTSTTSLCLTMLNLGFKTAHTAYTVKTFEQAQVIADTPIFCDYQQLAEEYPNAKFIYLKRDLASWLPSIKQLLARMQMNLIRKDGGFNPTIKRCYLSVFAPFSLENIADDKFLAQCYLKHQQEVEQYFSNRTDDLLTIDISDKASFTRLCCFLIESGFDIQPNDETFPHVNIGGKVTAWKQIKHPLKVESTASGRVDKVF